MSASETNFGLPHSGTHTWSERHYTCPELAALWHMSSSRIRTLFQNEPGVIKLGLPSRRLGRKLKRRYVTLYIPVSVAARVHSRLSKGAV